MPIPVSNVSTNQTFSSWLTTTNILARIVSQNAMTVDVTSNGSVATGNSYVNGHFGSNVLYVNTALQAGRPGTNGSTINVQSNTAFRLNTSNLVTITSNSTVSQTTLITSDVAITPANTVTITGLVLSTNVPNTNINATSIGITGVTTATGNVTFRANSTVTLAQLTGNTTVRAFTVNVDSVDVTGNTTLSNTLVVTGAANLLSTFGVSGAANLFSTARIVGATTLANTLAVTGATTLSNTLVVTGAANTLSTLGVSGAANLFSTVEITGATTLANTLSVTGATTLSNTLSVSGNVSGQSINLTGTVNGSVLSISTSANIGTTLGIGTNLTVFGESNLVGNTTFSNSILVIGQTNTGTLYTVGSANVAGNLRVVGNLIVQGNVSYTGTSASDILPASNNAFNIGSPSLTWATGYFSTIQSTNVTATDTITANTLNLRSVAITVANTFTFVNSNTTTVVDAFPVSQFRSAEYLIQTRDTTGTANSFQVTKMILVHDGSTVYTTEYATITSNTTMGIFNAAINTANLELRFTPISNNVVVKLTRTGITL
jgi:cytoskeletal protein CcmA (bactofilin family)